MRSFAVLGLAAAVALLLMACGGSKRGEAPGAGTETALGGKITVFAAASLTDAFGEIRDEFERRYPGTEVVFNFGGSPTLRTQLEQGARADIFASADEHQMALAVQSGVVADGGTVFARNSLVMITPASNPGRVGELADLRRSGLKLVLANPDVPVGAYARQMLASLEKDAAYGAGFGGAVLKNVVSLESNVKQVVAKVELGEADAAIVYGTDVTPSVVSKLRTVAVPARYNVIAEYPIATTREAANPRLAGAFIDFVLSVEGGTILKKYGFQSGG